MKAESPIQNIVSSLINDLMINDQCFESTLCAHSFFYTVTRRNEAKYKSQNLLIALHLLPRIYTVLGW